MLWKHMRKYFHWWYIVMYVCIYFHELEKDWEHLRKYFHWRYTCINPHIYMIYRGCIILLSVRTAQSRLCLLFISSWFNVGFQDNLAKVTTKVSRCVAHKKHTLWSNCQGHVNPLNLVSFAIWTPLMIVCDRSVS